jgi:hypothetical protein
VENDTYPVGTFYSSGLYWAFFYVNYTQSQRTGSDGTNLAYSTSSGGMSWTQPVTLETGIVQAKVWYDGKFLYIAYVLNSQIPQCSYPNFPNFTSSVYYWRGSPAGDGKVVWSTPNPQLAYTESLTDPCGLGLYSNQLLIASVRLDWNGDPWLVLYVTQGHKYAVSFDYQIVKSSTNDGSFLIQQGFPLDLGTAQCSTNPNMPNEFDCSGTVQADVAPISGGSVVLIACAGTNSSGGGDGGGVGGGGSGTYARIWNATKQSWNQTVDSNLPFLCSAAYGDQVMASLQSGADLVNIIYYASNNLTLYSITYVPSNDSVAKAEVAQVGRGNPGIYSPPLISSVYGDDGKALYLIWTSANGTEMFESSSSSALGQQWSAPRLVLSLTQPVYYANAYFYAAQCALSVSDGGSIGVLATILQSPTPSSWSLATEYLVVE